MFYYCLLKGCRFYGTKRNRARSPKRTRRIQTLWRETHIAETSGKLQGKYPFLGVLSNVSNNNRTSILMCKKDDNGPLCDSQLFDCLFCCLIVHFHSLFSSFMHCHHYNVHILKTRALCKLLLSISCHWLYHHNFLRVKIFHYL